MLYRELPGDVLHQCALCSAINLIIAVPGAAPSIAATRLSLVRAWQRLLVCPCALPTVRCSPIAGQCTTQHHDKPSDFASGRHDRPLCCHVTPKPLLLPFLLAVLPWQGVELVPGVSAHSYDLLTTPQLHWLVRLSNHGSSDSSDKNLPGSSIVSSGGGTSNDGSEEGSLLSSHAPYAPTTSAAAFTAPAPAAAPTASAPPAAAAFAPESAYFSSLAAAYAAFFRTFSRAPAASGIDPASDASMEAAPAGCLPALAVDAANGVGGVKLQQLLRTMREEQGVGMRAEVRNTGEAGSGSDRGRVDGDGGTLCTGDGAATAVTAAVAAGGATARIAATGGGRLNEGVGADFVQKEQKEPAGFDRQRDASLR